MTRSEAIEKLKRFCDYRERCHSEVRTKLISLKVYGNQLEEVMSELIKEDFLNEERYARSYVRGKFRINNWGRIKIIQHLKAKNISAYCIKKGLEEIDEVQYEEVIMSVLQKYKRTKKGLPTNQLIQATIQYGLSRGFESIIIQRLMPQIIAAK